MDAIRKALHDVEVGEAVEFGGLALYPLLAREVPEHRVPPYWSQQEAVLWGCLDAREMCTSHGHQEIWISNRDNCPVLLLDGEGILGSEENLVLSQPVLAPPREGIHVPLSILASRKGRWSSRHLVFSSLNTGELYGMFFSGARPREMCCREATLGAYTRTLRWREGQMGAVFAMAGRVVGLEILDHPRSFRHYLPFFVKNYAMDAIEWGGPEPAPPAAVVGDLLHELGGAGTEPVPGPGLGEVVRIGTERMKGGALVEEGRLVRLGAGFPPHPSTVRQRIGEGVARD